ncbi:hypothetical protein QVD17_34327 [Tagetes erecta]|uniref:Uncharacterized protein n=1 Tax=Tagetes erecta TaxID=13708 RepID=A0AAD8JZT4_TARER|nr:hypothetical protein QVD17_34327 [Tagetes erecta]
MIPSSFYNQPTIFKASILLHIIIIIPAYKLTHPQSQLRISSITPPMPLKKLQRLPHVFSNVLELPLRSQADVFIQDTSDCFKFTANIDSNAFSGQVRAYAVNIHPGVIKVVIRGGNIGEVELLLDQLEIDVWRFRLPATTRPELSTAVVAGRKLVVTVPKGGRNSYGGDDRVVWGGGKRRLVSV